MRINLDRYVEQLAFGKEPPKTAACLGLYLSPDVVYLSETRRAPDGRITVEHLVRVPLAGASRPAGATATMNADFLSDPARVAEPIRPSIAQMKWSGRSARVTLSHHLGLLRYFTVPAMPRRFLKSAVPLEAKKYIPIPFEVLTHDFQPVAAPPDASGRPRQGVLIAVTQKKNLSALETLLGHLGLSLEALEVAPCSVLRLWSGLDPSPAPRVRVHVDGGSVRIMIIDRGIPVFFREVFLGSSVELGDLRRIDLPGCLAFAGKQLGLAGVERLLISGNAPNLEALRDALSAETGVPAEIQDIPRQLSLKGGDWGAYASLGASARLPGGEEAASLDLAAKNRVSEEERHTARSILLAGAAAAALLCVLGGVRAWSTGRREKELRGLQRQVPVEVAQALNGLDEGAIETLLRDMRAQLELLDAATGGRRLKVSALLREVVATMPENAWLERITIASPLASEKQPFELTLRGHVQDRTVAAEQTGAFRFKDALAAHPSLGKAYDISASVSRQPAGEDSSGMDGSNSFARRLEERTTFVFQLRSKR